VRFEASIVKHGSRQLVEIAFDIKAADDPELSAFSRRSRTPVATSTGAGSR